MSERLRHLQRQRALLSEHLAWIDSEISRETPPAAVATNLTAAPAASPAPADVTVTASAADALIEKYAADERQNPADLRRGCLYVFISALALIAFGIVSVWWLFYR